MDRQPVLADARRARTSPTRPSTSRPRPAGRPSARSPTSLGFSRRSRRPVSQKKASGSATRKPTPRASMPVRPLPPEDALELVKGHVLVDLLVLRNLLVFLEFFLPFRLVERRDDAVDRLPFGDRQAGTGHARGATDHDQRKQHDQHEIEPAADQRPIAQFPVAFGEAVRQCWSWRTWRSFPARSKPRTGGP